MKSYFLIFFIALTLSSSLAPNSLAVDEQLIQIISKQRDFPDPYTGMSKIEEFLDQHDRGMLGNDSLYSVVKTVYRLNHEILGPKYVLFGPEQIRNDLKENINSQTVAKKIGISGLCLVLGWFALSPFVLLYWSIVPCKNRKVMFIRKRYIYLIKMSSVPVFGIVLYGAINLILIGMNLYSINKLSATAAVFGALFLLSKMPECDFLRLEESKNIT